MEMLIEHIIPPGDKMTVEHQYVNDDWQRILINGQVFYENHSIRPDIWMEVLIKTGVNTIQTTINDDPTEDL